MNWKTLFLSAEGRIAKRDFWIGAAILFGAGFVANMLPLIGAVAGLVLLYPWTCLVAKRLHDFGRSAWLVLVPVVPAAASGVLALVTTMAMGNAATMAAGFAAAGLTLLVSTLAILFSLAFLLWVGLKDGDAATNAYGSPASPAFGA